jgi:hypothetical protein
VGADSVIGERNRGREREREREVGRLVLMKWRNVHVGRK